MNKNMYAVIVSVIMCLGFFCSANSDSGGNDHDSNYEDIPLDINANEDTSLDKFNIQHFYSPQGEGDAGYPSSLKIYSVEELQNNEAFPTHIKEKMKTYDELFFKDNFLLFVLIVEGSGSVTYEILSVDMKDSSMDILIKQNAPEIVTCEMAWHYFVFEMNRELLDKTVAINFNT